MSHDKKPKKKYSSPMIGVRVNAEQKDLIEKAAEREGLQISSFIIMLLVRLHILPDGYLKKLKRRPVPFFNDLHELIGAVNKVGGNCKQLLAVMPDTAGLRATHNSLLHAADAVTDALHGKTIPVGVNLGELEHDLTKEGYAFNWIVKSVNEGKPQLSSLRPTLAAICQTANAITAALTGEPVPNADMAYMKDLAGLAMEEMRGNMHKDSG